LENYSMTTTTYAVAGLTCGNCVNAVSGELAALGGVHAVDVELVAGGTSRVTVTSDVPLTRADMVAALDEAGDYRLAD
jgi:copper chaperone CopZ